jgi:hypothetical protein
MNNNQSKLNTIFLGIIAISFLAIAIKQYLPSYVPNGHGGVVETTTGKGYVGYPH